MEAYRPHTPPPCIRARLWEGGEGPLTRKGRIRQFQTKIDLASGEGDPPPPLSPLRNGVGGGGYASTVNFKQKLKQLGPLAGGAVQQVEN